MLALECIVLTLLTPVLIAVRGVSTPIGLGIGLGLAFAALLLAATLRTEWAYYGGFALQVAALAVGLLVPVMVVLGLVFGGLWTTAYVLGKRIEAEQSQWPAASADPPAP